MNSNINKLGTGEVCSKKNNKKITISCGLDVDLDPRDKVIYLCPGKLQFFTFNVLKACGDVSITPKNKCEDKIIIGNLAEYRIFANGILVNVYKNLNYLRNDILIFTVIDECSKSEQEFAVVFGYNYENHSCIR